MLHQVLTGQIIGAAMKILNVLGPGHDEKLYERALVIELQRQKLVAESQRQFPVHYDNVMVGNLIPDLIVNNLVIVDAKVADDFHEAHVRQMLSYLTVTGMELALLVNFKHATLRWKRIINERKPSAPQRPTRPPAISELREFRGER
jgi:GxxExxY protein